MIMRKRSLVAAAVLALTLAGGLVATSRNDRADAAIGGQTWADDFDGPAGAPIDGNKWRFDLGNNNGWGNGELETYTNSTSNVSLDGQGHLAITARREGSGYTSGRILTADRFSQAYGRFEASIQIPKGQGIWPAFWMLGGGTWPDGGEIDIMENVGFAPNTVYGTVHGPGYSGANGIGGNRSIGAALGDGFHNYRVDWSPGLIIWYLDGSEYFRVTPNDIRGNRWVFDHPFYMILNVAVGGGWPGNPDGSTQFPQTMLVDYVHVSSWADGPSGGATALRSAASGRCLDIPAANPVDGVRLQIYDCNGTAAQQWAINGDGSVQALGKCMDAAAAGTAAGTVIQLYTCNGSSAQKFTLSPAGDLVNLAANRCVDVSGAGTANGTQLVLWDCSGAPNQKWSRG
jgi:beta-glucanase (GH16 family)